MKKLLIGIFTISILIGLIASTVVGSARKISVTFNGEAIEFFDQEPVIVNNRVLVPIRGIFEKMGATVDWDEKTSTVIITGKGNDSIEESKNYPFYENGWKINNTNLINKSDYVYTVSLFDNKLHYTENADDGSYQLSRTLEYAEGEQKAIFLGMDYGEFGGGLLCVAFDTDYEGTGTNYFIAGSRILDLFVYNGEIYYSNSEGHGWNNYLGKIKFDKDMGIWVDDKNYKLYSKIVEPAEAENRLLLMNDMILSHYIDNENNLYVISNKAVYLVEKDNALKTVFTKAEWSYMGNPMIKLGDTFYTGAYGGIASYNPITKEQYFWTK